MIYLALLNGDFFGSNGHDWRSMDIARIEARFKEKNTPLTVVTLEDVLDLELSPDDMVWYCSHMHPAINGYVKSVLYFADKRARITPRYELLMAYENKGFQYLLANAEGIPRPDGGYTYHEAGLPQHYPYVLKSASGAGSAGVHLVRSEADRKRASKHVFPWPILSRIKTILRTRRLPQRDRGHYRIFRGALGEAAFQSFIPGLQNDFKVRVFGDRYYVMKRHVRENDFRASGSGLVDYPVQADAVLDFAETVFTAMRCPYASIDVAEAEDGCHLIEYQATNFGINTLVPSPGYFVRSDGDGSWQFVPSEFSVERDVADAVIGHLA